MEVSDFFKEKLNGLVEAAVAKDVEAVELIAADIIDALIDVPGLDDESERMLFEGAIQVIVGAITGLLKK